MRFLVTGANGLVGSRLCSLLAASGHGAAGLGLGPKRVAYDLEYYPCDITEPTRLEEVYRSIEPEVVIHSAAMTELDACERDPQAAHAVNVQATEAIANLAQQTGAHLVYVSTDYVFDGEAGPYSEEDAPNPRGVYAESKYKAEQAVQTLCSSWTIARPAIVYGWPPAGHANFGSWVLSKLLKGETVPLFEDQFVSPSFVGNVAAMLVELGERCLPGIWHTSGSQVVDRVSFGQALCETMGFDAGLLRPVKLAEMNLASPRPRHSGLETSKAAQILATKPLDLKESLAHFHLAFEKSKA